MENMSNLQKCTTGIRGTPIVTDYLLYKGWNLWKTQNQHQTTLRMFFMDFFYEFRMQIPQPLGEIDKNSYLNWILKTWYTKNEIEKEDPKLTIADRIKKYWKRILFTRKIIIIVYFNSF